MAVYTNLAQFSLLGEVASPQGGKWIFLPVHALDCGILGRMMKRKLCKLLNDQWVIWIKALLYGDSTREESNRHSKSWELGILKTFLRRSIAPVITVSH